MTSSSTAPLVALAALLLAALLLAAGCASSSGTTAAAGPPPQRLDSLRAANLRLRETTADLRDSLRLVSDVQTGRYYRRLRSLHDRISRMAFALTSLRKGGQTVEVLGADALFEPASSRLTGAGRVRLDTLAARLRRTYPRRRLLVEGHSDGAALSAELKKTYPSNWALSALRAASVTRYLTEGAGLAKDRFTLAAYADTQPTASNQTAEGRRRNRRVRVAVLPSPNAYAGSEDDW